MIHIKDIENAWQSNMNISHAYPKMSERNKKQNLYERIKKIALWLNKI